MVEKVRLDKFLHAVRLFKTRSLATENCKKGRVLINNIPAKPSRLISVGEIIEIKFPPIVRVYKTIALIEKRTSAKFVEKYIEEITPASELEKLKIIKTNISSNRAKGLGRPTKRERRDIDNLRNQNT